MTNRQDSDMCQKDLRDYSRRLGPSSHSSTLIAILCCFFSIAAYGEENLSQQSNTRQGDNSTGAFDAIQRRLDQYREDQAHWDSLIRGQRRGHNFSLLFDRATPQWTFSPNNNPIKFGFKPAYSTKFQYEFHIPLHKGFGYYLGSNIGYTYSQRAYADDVYVCDIIQLPGVIAGLFLNISSAARLGLNAQGYLERVEKLSAPVGTGAGVHQENMYFNTRAWAVGLTLDLFFKLEWALRFEVERMEATYTPVSGITDDIVMDRYIRRNEMRYGMGVLFHSI